MESASDSDESCAAACTVTVAALLHAQVAAWQQAPVGNKAVSQLI
jgi:hypothetical protein